MLKKSTCIQNQIEIVILEDLVPQNHLLRKIDKYIDFSFIYDLCEGLYSKNNGRPGVDPVVFFKALLIGFLFGVRSERRLIEEIKVNLAYRWFLGLSISDKVFHHSTFSQNRRRRFLDSDVYEKIFVKIILLAIDHGFIQGDTLYTDSTHLKANANKNKKVEVIVEEKAKDYLDILEECVNQDREENNKKALKPSIKTTKTKKIKQSKTDPDSGFMARDGKPQGFFYLDHRTTDSKHNFIVDVHITPGNVNDSVPYLSRLQHIMEQFAFDVKNVGLDAGYSVPHICKTLVDMDITGVIAYKRPSNKKGMIPKKYYRYDEKNNVYICPENHVLIYNTTNRDGYKVYVSDPKICEHCPRLKECTKSKYHKKTVHRHVWQNYKDIIKSNRLTDDGKEIYARRKETIERSFADAKELHGYRYARFRGEKKVYMQSLLTAICQNIKKFVTLLSRKEKISKTSSFLSKIYAIILQYTCRSQKSIKFA